MMIEPSDAHSMSRRRALLGAGMFGRWAAGFAAATLIGFIALLVFAYLDIRFAPLIAVFFLAGIAALVNAILALLLERDRTVITWASLVVGVLATALLVAEFTILE